MTFIPPTPDFNMDRFAGRDIHAEHLLESRPDLRDPATGRRDRRVAWIAAIVIALVALGVCIAGPFVLRK